MRTHTAFATERLKEMSNPLELSALFDSVQEMVAFLSMRDTFKAALADAGPSIFVVTERGEPHIAYIAGMPGEAVELDTGLKSLSRLARTAELVIARFHPTSSMYSRTAAAGKEDAYVLLRTTHQGRVIGVVGEFPAHAGTMLCLSVARSHGLMAEEQASQCLDRFCEGLLEHDPVLRTRILDGLELVE